MERRAHQRFRIFKGASILSGIQPAVDCTVRNICDGGACIDVPTLVLPQSFSLLIRPEGVRRDCQIAWRSERRIGVQFV